MGGFDGYDHGASQVIAVSTTTSPPWEGTSTTGQDASACRDNHTTRSDAGPSRPSTETATSAPAPATEAAVRGIKPIEAVEAPFADEVGEPWMSAKDQKALRRGVEWYFSDSNLSTDQALHHKISQRLPEGWLCCSELIRLEPLRQLGATPELLLKCLRKSFLETKVTLTADELRAAVGKPAEFGKRGVFVRRRQPLPPLLSRDQIHLNAQANCDPAKFVLADRHHTMNRLRDLWRVQRQLKISEIGDDVTVFRERVLPNVSPENRPHNDTPVVFAIGYERVVYGDHGPYIEFSSSHIRWKAWPHFFEKKKKYNSYFDEYYTKASHSIWEARWKLWDPNATKGLLMLYAQSRSVSDRPWAPGAQSDPHAGRPTGYADYRPGYFYAAADESLVIVEKED